LPFEKKQDGETRWNEPSLAILESVIANLYFFFFFAATFLTAFFAAFFFAATRNHPRSIFVVNVPGLVAETFFRARLFFMKRGLMDDV
jgi:hypothetical protein